MKAKISAQAQTVLDILAAKRCHLTADEILEGLDGIGTATVYRALDHLTEMGLIRRLSSAETCTISRRILPAWRRKPRNAAGTASTGAR